MFGSYAETLANSARSLTETVTHGVSAGASSISEGAQAVTGGLTSSFTTLSVLKADTKMKVLAMPAIVPKVGRVIDNMKSSAEMDFSDEEVDMMVRAIYVTKSDEDLQATFTMIDTKFNMGQPEGSIMGEDMKSVLPLCGEDVTDEQVKAIFEAVDADESGSLELKEFKRMLLELNPTPESASMTDSIPGYNVISSGVGDIFHTMKIATVDMANGVSNAASTVPGVSTVASGIGSTVGGITDSMTTLSVLSTSTKTKVLAKPAIIPKVGRIIKSLRSSASFDFSDDDIDLIIRSSYITRSDEDFAAAFEMLDKKFNMGDVQGFIIGDDFRPLLKLCGENVSDDQVDAIFRDVDKDGSGNLELNEFKAMMIQMNPASE